MKSNLLVNLPPIDEVATKMAVETELEKALFYKLTEIDRREATVTASYSERFHGPTNVTSDQTAQVALHNVAEEEKRRQHVTRVERLVETRLSRKQKQLIKERYLTEFGVYDVDVYAGVMEISPTTYTKIRNEAFYILAFALGVYVEKDTGKVS